MISDVVSPNRTIDGNHDTIDVHGTTVAEATVIVKEILDEEGPSISQSGFLLFVLSFHRGRLLVLCVHLTQKNTLSIPKDKPLKIVTGKGNHSVGGVGVLKPAIRDALVADGWIVGSFAAGLVVKGQGRWP